MINPEVIRQQLWQALHKACADKAHPFNTAVLATVSPHYAPQQRTVVLRNVWQNEHLISCYTDWRSAKIRDLAANENTSWLFYDAGNKVQLRLSGSTKIYRQNEHTRNIWDGLSDHSRRAYLAEPGPGSPTEPGDDGLAHLHSDEAAPAQGYANFAIISTSVFEMDWLWLSDEGHKRIGYKRNGNKWLAEGLIP